MQIANTPLQIEPLLKAADVARLLNVSKSQVYLLMETELPSIRFGRKSVRVRLSDLEAYIAGHLQGGDNE